MSFYFLVVYGSGGNLKLVNEITTGMVKKFHTRRDARKYARQNMLGVYKIYEFEFE